MCGFQWNHWSLANLPVDALMYDFNDSHALAIPADFSRTVSAMIPETVQGRTSAASPLLKGRSGDPAEMERALRNSGAIADQGAIFLTGKA